MTVTEEPSISNLTGAARKPSTMLRAIVLVAVVILAAVAGAVVGRVSAGSTPGDDSVDAGFARDMSTHHSQAVEMAILVAERSSSTEIKVLAYDIALTQQEQIGRMKGWLVSWHLSPTGSRPPMAWMSGHAGHGGPQMSLLPDGRMPGMASQADMARLRSLTGRPAEVLFLRLMVVHHRAGITMAEYAAQHADKADIRELADAMAAGQTSEIQVLNGYLRDRGAPPA
ncbi:MAG: DUF305 domain-containing protein [Mycobacteriales bacterium]